MTVSVDTTQQTGWTADASTFGARLALIRQRMHWGNVKEAAEACGVPVESWRRWERDDREPHRRDRISESIARASGCDYLWLVHGPGRGVLPRMDSNHEPAGFVRVRRHTTRRPVTRPREAHRPGRPVAQTRPRTHAIPRQRNTRPGA
jgi:hypothetical protein